MTLAARRLLVLAVPLALGFPAASASEHAAHPEPAVSAPSPAPSPASNGNAAATQPADARVTREEEYASLLRLGEKKLNAKDAESAILSYREALRLAKGAEVPPALLGLARGHRLAGDGVKASATYELLLKEHPHWNGVPIALLELGRTLRELGATQLAIARFFSVIQSTLRLPEAETENYRRLVRTAQFEIAETHFQSGNTAEAVRYFRRLDALDLAPADRARARFRTAQSQLLEGDRVAAVATLERMLAQDGEAAEAAEARFLLARIHAEEGRRDEALRVTLELLRSTSAVAERAAWREWQRRAGNFLAGRFKLEGEHHSALLLYRALALLDASPATRAPALYEIGLCLEQLKQPAEARAAYAELVELIGKDPAPGTLEAELARMARWRGEQLEWAGRAEGEISRLSTAVGAASVAPSPDRS